MASTAPTQTFEGASFCWPRSPCRSAAGFFSKLCPIQDVSPGCLLPNLYGLVVLGPSARVSSVEGPRLQGQGDPLTRLECWDPFGRSTVHATAPKVGIKVLRTNHQTRARSAQKPDDLRKATRMSTRFSRSTRRLLYQRKSAGSLYSYSGPRLR